MTCLLAGAGEVVGSGSALVEGSQGVMAEGMLIDE